MTQTVARERRAPSGIARSIVGGFFLCMGGVHIGIVATDATNYGPFAEGALFPFVRAGWNEVFMAALAVLVPLARRDWPRLSGRMVPTQVGP